MAGKSAHALPADPAGPDTARSDPRLLDVIGRKRALTLGLLPLYRKGAITVLAATDANSAKARRPELEQLFGPVALTPVEPGQIERRIAGLRRAEMVRRAETSVPLNDSCRRMDGLQARLSFLGVGTGLLVFLTLAPIVLLQTLLAVAVICLASMSFLRTAALIGHFRQPSAPRHTDVGLPTEAPVVTLLVPLFREETIAGRLVKRLERLTYPRDKLDICLVVESDDARTRRALARANLPGHMRVITVPAGQIRTKPRALNYALPFAQGDIVGIYDAEDAPAPDQLHHVVAAFAANGPDVACVQGILSYYNPRNSWITRCFTIDYATWFRVILPGLARMGLVLPLGGTTLFFRRTAIEALDGWDAHNVTEDADLGLRLARRGYRTVLIPSVTEEEATARALPWIRQRSRWLKGYALTWVVHMRRPLTLWGELGAKRFLGVQILFLGTILQYALWPVLLVFWALALFTDAAPAAAIEGWPLTTLSVFFVLSELLVIATGLVAVASAEKRWLMPWVPTMIAYFPLGVVALYKGLFEVVTNPFFWDKTQHGQNGG